MQAKAEFVVVANRLPVRSVDSSQSRHWETSPGGLVSALMPVLADHAASAWVGWAGEPGDAPDPFTHDGIRNVPVELSANDIEMYYEGFANRTLWPLYHDAIRPAQYQRRWWRAYLDANIRFTRAAAAVAAHTATVWVHDYHLHLVPGLLRELRPDLRIGFFLHIPFPGRGLFSQLPWRAQLLKGTLGADVVGFQTNPGAQNFTDLAEKYAGATKTETGVRFEHRDITVRAFPIAIDTKAYERIARDPVVVQQAQKFRQRLGNRKIILGVDRMDYTKGIDIRLRALQDLLTDGRLTIDQVVMLQSAVPTRERVTDYAELRSDVEQLVGHINGEFGAVGLVGVQYMSQNLDTKELVALYLAADVMLVTPFRDGMNLVAKEYVACRPNDTGVLVLSEFTGAATQLEGAVIVNPHDLDGLANAIDHAVHMPEHEMRERMAKLRAHVREHDVQRWARSFLAALEDAA